MVGPYRGLFDGPGVKGFVLAGFVGRMPMSMLGIGIVLLVSGLTESYATAGAVAATTNLSFAVAAPMSGRLVDRFGQTRVIAPFASLNALALAALMLSAGLRLPEWTLYAAALLVGATSLSLGSMVRARWSALHGGSPRLHTAFAFESVVDEVIFVTGPALVTVLATEINPFAGLAVALVCMLGGSLALAGQRSTQPPVQPVRGGGGTPILIPGVALLACVYLGLGAVFGSVDLITVAFAEEHGVKGAAGFLLAAFAGGSMVSGLWFGSRHWRISLRGRFLRALAVFVAGLTPLTFIGAPWVMAGFLFLAGLAISPTLITGFSLTERLVPPSLLTEGMAWISTSIGFGVALGAWAGGRLTESVGASDAYLFALAAALFAALVGAAGSGLLRLPEAASPAES
ncbi:MFS transporter [Nonomuraea roseoviolacea subsp. roseoviolacea]|uniref:MFS family arabinose efflux permease n=1 Tax=Nonomuraea roseoviolacea subsp. carminata TaxID=160689 RepID=A0ABT1K780_9ACTN|nr:MFS transporter [Nonomuraea roseoviolacea]MCP2349848.1 putative MFS family arabinose efflux permease [Nonomuraea roseoviolacea subsp. carminata]